MFKTKRAAFVLCCLLAVKPVFANTLEELVAKQREAMAAEAEKKANANKPAPAPVVPTFVPPAKEKESNVDDLRLIAIYGVGQRLTADIYYNGAVFSVMQGAETIDGWRAESINSSRVVLRQFVAKAGRSTAAKRHVMYLAAPTMNVTTPNAQAQGLTSPAAPISSLPPLPAFNSGR